jgi:hypothetical protein
VDALSYFIFNLKRLAVFANVVITVQVMSLEIIHAILMGKYEYTT